MTTKITTDNILDGTIDSVDIKNSSIDLSSSKVTGSVPTANLPTIPVSKGGTGLTSLGSAGQAVKVNSGASALEFGSAGGLVLVTSVTLSNVASVSFTSIDSTYETYVFMLNNVVPASDGVQLLMRTSTDGGSSFDSTSGDYDQRSASINNSGTFESTGSTSADAMGLNQGGSNLGSASGESVSSVVYLFQPSNSSLFTTMSYTGIAIYNDGSARTQFGSGGRMATESVDAVQFLMSSGNLESGEINMYGVVK